MKIIAITHAEKDKGANPALTEKGKADIRALASKLPKDGVKNIIIGTGKRFLDIFDSLCGEDSGWAKLGGLVDTIRYCPLIGSADSGKMTESGFEVILADGTQVKMGDYIGLIGTPGIDLWAWLGSLPPETLLCTGREFIGSLGVKDAQTARMYVIDTDNRTVTVVS